MDAATAPDSAGNSCHGGDRNHTVGRLSLNGVTVSSNNGKGGEARPKASLPGHKRVTLEP